jgi:Xaa-Pro aminopeptidase
MKLRALKSPSEIEALRRAAEITEAARNLTYDEFVVGTTERDLYGQVAANLFRCGSHGVGYILAKHQDRPFGYSDRVFERNDIVYWDSGGRYKGYQCDIQRLAVLGQASDEVSNNYRRLHELLQAMLDAVRPGTSVARFNALYLDLIAKFFGHLGGAAMTPRWCGHGIGLENAEEPSLSLDSRAVLEAGMTILVEPFVLVGDTWYTTEDCVLVTESGWSAIGSPTPPDLPIIAIRENA